MKIKREGKWESTPKEKSEKERKEKAKTDFSKAGNTQTKIDVIAEYLGLKTP